MRKIYITDNVESFADDKAEQRLAANNDLQFFNEQEQGIHKVSKERWQSAQKYEKITWERNVDCQDDRNLDHLEKFNSFECIKNEIENKSIIELGCGPFTNMRLLVELFSLDDITLLDPLASEYVFLKHCPYKDGKLKDKVVKIVSSSIEDYDFEKKFDIIMMINVLEHCFDINAIFDKILNVLNNKGIFIFADVYFKDVKNLASNLYDAGHPLRLSEFKMNEFLKSFDAVFDQRYHELFGQEWRNDIYFIGRKYEKNNQLLALQ